MNVSAVLAKVKAGHQPGLGEIVTLLSAREDQAKELFTAADQVRRAGVGEAVHLRALIEFSNHCISNCLYCGLRRDNRHLPRYRLSGGEILAAAEKAAAMGYRTVVLQSGEDPVYGALEIARIVEKIKARTKMAITLSLGERTREEYRAWREAGADRYLLKHETADENLFYRLRPGRSLQGRLECLYWLKDLGYQAGSGNMVGLPGQGLDTLARDIMLMRCLDVEMAGIGPFLPHPATPLKDAGAGSPGLTFRVLAVTRLCLPEAHLPSTTALGALSPCSRRLALSCGANVIMPNLTPAAVRDKYLIYPQKANIEESPDQALESIRSLLAGMARTLAGDCGHAKKSRAGGGGIQNPEGGNSIHENLTG